MTYYLPNNKPEESMRPMTIIYYGTDPHQAITLAQVERDNKRSAMLRDASAFWGEVEVCDAVWLTPTVSAHHRASLKEAYGDKVTELTAKDMPKEVAQKAETKPMTSLTRKRLSQEAKANVTKSAASVPDYRQMTNKELRSLVAERGLDVGRATSKEQLIAALESAA